MNIRVPFLPLMTKPISVERGLEITLLLVLSGAMLLFVGMSDALDWSLDLDGWGFYPGSAGVILLVVGVFWMASIIKRMRRFKSMMKERSKALFVRSLDELEYMAWRLPSKYDVLLSEKKREMGLK